MITNTNFLPIINPFKQGYLASSLGADVFTAKLQLKYPKLTTNACKEMSFKLCTQPSVINILRK